MSFKACRICALMFGSRLSYFTQWEISARSSQLKPRLTNCGKLFPACCAALSSATAHRANQSRSSAYCASVERCNARSLMLIEPLPGKLASPPTPAELNGISQPSIRTRTPSRALARSRSPMLGALPSRMKNIDGWNPQQTMSTVRVAWAMAKCTAQNVSSPLTKGR
ncbi:hypothetical protein D3C76_1225390 [compost metagenome]